MTSRPLSALALVLLVLVSPAVFADDGITSEVPAPAGQSGSLSVPSPFAPAGDRPAADSSPANAVSPVGQPQGQESMQTPAPASASASKERQLLPADSQEKSQRALPAPAPASGPAVPASNRPAAESIEGPAQNQAGVSKGSAGAGAPGSGKGAPVKLFGRIEEIAAAASPQLPVRLKALVPKLDRAGQLKGTASASALLGQVSGSFPVDWRGTWGGQLKVWSVSYSPVRYQFDQEEARRETELLKPGTAGNVTFTFDQSAAGRVSLAPAQVIFTAQMDARQAQQKLDQMLGQASGSLAGSPMAPALAQIMQGVPVMYALHLGDLVSGVSVTGNVLQARVLKNEISELADGVLEQVVVTYDSATNRRTGQVRNGFSENVVRFTRQSSNSLYVQAVTVSYLPDGRFEDRCMLYGTVYRGQGGVGPGIPVTPGNPLEGLMRMLSQ